MLDTPFPVGLHLGLEVRDEIGIGGDLCEDRVDGENDSAAPALMKKMK